MRIVVVSDRRLSSLALSAALQRIPDAQVIAQVENLTEARRYCEAGETDVVVSDAAMMAGDGPDIAAAFGRFAGRGIAELTAIQRAVAVPPNASVLPWQIAPSDVQDLSSREREVFLLLGLGLSNRHVARALGVTERTIKTHVGRVLAKLGLESRLQAGLAALLYLAQRGADTGSGRPTRTYPFAVPSAGRPEVRASASRG